MRIGRDIIKILTVSFFMPHPIYVFTKSSETVYKLDDDMETENEYPLVIGLNDFFLFDLLLLLIVFANSSITIRVCIAISVPVTCSTMVI
jgi:hypothetical protein